jgi:transposase, IS6 family
MENIDFKWKYFCSEVIMLCVRWYLKYPLSYRNLEEIMDERGIKEASI